MTVTLAGGKLRRMSICNFSVAGGEASGDCDGCRRRKYAADQPQLGDRLDERQNQRNTFLAQTAASPIYRC